VPNELRSLIGEHYEGRQQSHHRNPEWQIDLTESGRDGRSVGRSRDSLRIYRRHCLRRIGQAPIHHDIDVFVRPEDAELTLRALAKSGFRVEKTDPVWLYKAFKENILSRYHF